MLADNSANIGWIRNQVGVPAIAELFLVRVLDVEAYVLAPEPCEVQFRVGEWEVCVLPTIALEVSVTIHQRDVDSGFKNRA